MRLLMVASNFPPVIGGIQTYGYQLARELSRHFQLQVVAPLSEHSARFDAGETQRGFDLVRLRAYHDDLAFSGIARLAKLLRAQRFDAAFTTHWAPSFAVQRAARLARRKLLVFSAAHGKELIHEPLARFGAPAQRVYAGVRALALRGTSGFFPVSERTAQLLVEAGVTRERITVVHNGVDPELYRPADAAELRRELAPQGPLVLSAARLVSRKGIDTMLRALPAIVAEVRNLRYAVAGDGPDRDRLLALARELGVAEHVRFLRRAQGNLVDYYNACDLFVLPAREERTDIEGFGLVFLEAGACAKPVIGARAGGVTDAIFEGETGLLVPPDEPKALARAVLELLRDPERGRRMGQAARERILREGTWSHAADKIRTAIERAVRSD